MLLRAFYEPVLSVVDHGVVEGPPRACLTRRPELRRSDLQNEPLEIESILLTLESSGYRSVSRSRLLVILRCRPASGKRN